MAGAAALLVSACVSLTPDQVYPIGFVEPVDPAVLAETNDSAAESVRTASPGEILFQQPVSTLSILRLENDIVTDGDVSLAVQARTVEFTRGMGFYPALSVGSRTELAACSYDRPATWVPRLNPGASAQGKICFILNELDAAPGDEDDQIERAEAALRDGELSSSTFFFVSEGVGMGVSSQYQRLARWDPQLTYRVVEPARFSIDRSPAADPSAPSLALRYVDTAQGALIEPVYLINGQPAAINGKGRVISADQTFPTVIEVEGARIEVLALVDRALAYRVLSGLPASNAAVLDLPQ
ncbi:MAG: hypothetical protein NXI12_13860 [Alphaproteobacteria bacterium]|nr:hypothetical protein [Alphaproteobacteria bacterium]